MKLASLLVLLPLSMIIMACAPGLTEEEARLIAREEISSAIQRVPAGPRGPQGVQGPIGPAGKPGPAGSLGPVGRAGELGPPVERGPAGEERTRGERGPQGLGGERGSAGERGPAGERGTQGEIGLVGPRGPQGPPGFTKLTQKDERRLVSLANRLASLEKDQDGLVERSKFDIGLSDTLNLSELERCIDSLEDAIDAIARNLLYDFGLYSSPFISCSSVVGGY